MKKIVPITSLAELTSITQQLSIPEKLLQPTGILQDTRQRGLHDLQRLWPFQVRVRAGV